MVSFETEKFVLRQELDMRRRDFITLFGGPAVAWPLAARAQQPERVRRIGYLAPGRPVPQIYVPFSEALRQLGWIEGKNVLVEFRYGENDADRLRPTGWRRVTP